MHKNEKRYTAATRANFSDEELRLARANWEWGAKRMPAEHAEAAALIEAKGLGGHREVTAYYLRNKMPISARELSAIEIYKDTTYAGPFGRGEAKIDTPTTAGGTKLDALFTPTVKPEGAN